MGKKIGKSVFTTGAAATTLFSGLSGHKAQAEEIVQNDPDDQQSTDVTEMDSSFMDKNILHDQLQKAEKRVEDQRLRLNQAQSEYNMSAVGWQPTGPPALLPRCRRPSPLLQAFSYMTVPNTVSLLDLGNPWKAPLFDRFLHPRIASDFTLGRMYYLGIYFPNR